MDAIIDNSIDTLKKVDLQKELEKREKYKNTPLHAGAAGFLTASAARRILSNFPHLTALQNAGGQVPLIYAISYKRDDLLDYLLENADIVNTLDFTRRTPLFYACIFKNAEAMRILFEFSV